MPPQRVSLARWFASHSALHYGFVTAFCADRAWRNTAAKFLSLPGARLAAEQERIEDHAYT